MRNSTSFQPNDDNTNQSGGMIVIAQGLTSEPIQIPFPEMKTVDTLHANVVSQSGAVLHELSVNSPLIDFSGLLLPAGENKLVVWAGEDRKETVI